MTKEKKTAKFVNNNTKWKKAREGNCQPIERKQQKTMKEMKRSEGFLREGQPGPVPAVALAHFGKAPVFAFAQLPVLAAKVAASNRFSATAQKQKQQTELTKRKRNS